MELTRKQQELLRWYAGGHSIQMVAQYIDVDTREAARMIHELGIEDRWEAEALLSGSKDKDQLEDTDDNLPNAGEEVPEFIAPNVNSNKLQEYDKRKIAERGGNIVDVIPMAVQQAFRMDIRWRPLASIQEKWLSYTKGDEEALREVIKEFSPSAYKRLYKED